MSFYREAHLVLFLVASAAAQQYTPTQYFPTAGTVTCRANGGVNGHCKSINTCPSALGYLRANTTLPSCDRNNPRMVCCALERRISFTACETAKNVWRKSSAVIPLLPIDFTPEQPKEVVCDPNLNALISGGRDAKVDEMPFMAALGYNVNQVPWRCGGTLISPDTVLTAAHCVTHRTVGPPNKVLLGDITLSKRTSSAREIIPVSRVIVHPSYKPPLTYHDIAILKLARKVNISKSVMPACLPQAEDDLLKRIQGKKFTAAGFGITGVGEPQSDTLQVVNLHGFNHTLCDAVYREVPTKHIKFPNGIQRTQICAGDSFGRRDTCQGDSGGPLLFSSDKERCIHYVVGITSFGPHQCGEKIPAIYTNVLSYLDFIEGIVWGSNTS